MGTPVCAKCGGSGPSYCSRTSDLGEPAGEWYHPTCFALYVGTETSENLKRYGRCGGGKLPRRQGKPLREVWNQAGRAAQPVQRGLQGLQAEARRIRRSEGGKCL